MADSILRLKVESQEYDAKLKRATEGLQRYVDGCRKVGGTLEVVEKDTLEYVRSLGQMETVSRSATGKLAEMKKAFTELSMQYRQMTDAERQSPMGKALSQSLDQLNGRIAETRRQMDDVSRDMNGGGGLGGALDALASKFGLSIKQLTGWGAAIAATKVALDVAKDALFASETNVDEWGRTVEESKSVYQGFLQALNSGDISGYLNNINQITAAARDAYNALDELGTRQTILNPERAKLQARATELKAIIRREGASSEAGKAAKAELKSLEQPLTEAWKTESKLNRNAFMALVKEKLVEGGINLNQKSFNWFMKTFSDDAAFQELRRNAKGNIRTVPEYSELTGDVIGIKKVDTRNTNQKLLDLFTDEWRRNNSVYLSAAYQAQNSAASVMLSDARYLRDGKVSGYGSGKGSGGTVTDPITKAADEVTKAEQSYAESINIAQEKLMANVMKSEEYDKLVLSGQERLADAYLKAYHVTGNDKYLGAFRETSEHILDMRGVVDANIQAQKIAEQATREQAEAAKKLADAERKRSEQYANWQSNTTSGIANYISYQQGVLGQQSIGSGDYAQIASNLADANTYKNLMQVAIQNGLNDIVIDTAPLWQKIIGEVDVQDSSWKELQDKINNKLKELGIDPIKIDFATGNEAKQSGNKAEKHENQIGKVVSGMTSITNSLQHIGVEIPEGFNKVINIMNIIQTIMSTANAMGAAGGFLSNIPILGGFFSLFGLANGGVVHAANGFSGIVPGNLMSGDQIPALLDSGEVVLNRAQAGVLASDMRQGGIGYEGRTQAVIESDQIKLVLRNGAQARGMTISDYLEL